MLSITFYYASYQMDLLSIYQQFIKQQISQLEVKNDMEFSIKILINFNA